jgi:hypothetical protein
MKILICDPVIRNPTIIEVRELFHKLPQAIIIDGIGNNFNQNVISGYFIGLARKK